MTFQIAGRSIGSDSPPFVIAEMSGNNQSLDRAFELVEAAAASGAHALKLQTYTADTITLRQRGGDFVLMTVTVFGRQNLHDLYDTAHTPWEWHAPIISRARDLGLICFSSPFDESAIDFLEDLDVPAYDKLALKITTFLISKAASTGKPLIISTGMASLGELEMAVDAAREAGYGRLLLKCTSTYPATPDNTNIKTIPHLRELFGCEVGQMTIQWVLVYL